PLGDEPVRAIVATGRPFLFRVSSKVPPSTAGEGAIKDWAEGRAWYRPRPARAERRTPLACRLTRVPAQGIVRHDVRLPGAAHGGGERGRAGAQPASGPDRDPPRAEGDESRRAPSDRGRLRGCRADARKPGGPKASRGWPRREP